MSLTRLVPRIYAGFLGGTFGYLVSLYNPERFSIGRAELTRIGFVEPCFMSPPLYPENCICYVYSLIDFFAEFG